MDERDIRVGDTERERAISLLGEHFTAGRLDVHEYDQRCARAGAARFRGDLAELFADLPAPHPHTAEVPRTRQSPPAAPSGGFLRRVGPAPLFVLAALALVPSTMVRPLILVVLVLAGLGLWAQLRRR